VKGDSYLLSSVPKNEYQFDHICGFQACFLGRRRNVVYPCKARKSRDLQPSRC